MVRKVNIAEMEEGVRRFFRELSDGGESYLVVEDQGKPVVGIVPPWELEDREKQRKLLMKTVREVWDRTKDIPPEEIEREVEEAIREVRGEPEA